MNLVTKKLTFVLLFLLIYAPSLLFAQGVTTAGLKGLVSNKEGEVLTGATVIAVHVPSGTSYGSISLLDGRFFIPGMRVGGPYKVTVSFIGFENQVKENIFLTLGVTSDLNFTMAATNIEAGLVTVTAQRNAIFSSERTGAATSVGVETIHSLPTISRRIGDIVRLTPQASGNQSLGLSFAGQDTRFNNITVDGSAFNNSFGLSGQPGDRTGVSPISLDAIEQVQINVAPYDVRQGNFVGAGVNTVTKSGTNEFSGTAYYSFRHQGLVGLKARDFDVNPGTFKYNLTGFSVGGPIIKNKLFFFTNFETDGLTQPGTTWLANPGGAPITGSMTRVLASDLDGLSSFLKTNFGYETGSYSGYDNKTPSTRFIAKLDYNLDESNKLTLRYTQLDSKTDVLLSNSSSLGNGSRRSSKDALNFMNSNYAILENIKSIIGEWNSRLGDNLANNLIVGYTYQDESRESKGSMFPFVDILNNGTTYTSFGFEPFTPNNELRYKTFQFQDNLTYFAKDHTITLGISAERYESENVFYSGSQSVYVYNSLADFYTDANDYMKNPARTASPVTLKKFQVRWANIPGQSKPIQPLKVFYAGVYGQDEWQLNKDLKLTLGLRLDVPFFSATGFANEKANAMYFRDENGNQVQYATEKMPDANLLFSPRFGFNWDITGERSTQLRGGSGLFTGRPAYVWISNQIGNNGIITGFEEVTNTKARPFNPNPDTYKQAATGLPAASYELALTDPNFKFPQVWRTNLAVDQKLPFGLVGTAEFLYNRDVNGIYYINANLAAPTGTFSGPDNRLRWTTANNANRINTNIANATVMKNQDVGYSYNLCFAIEKPFSDGWFGKVGYNFSRSKNTVDPGSVASGSWSSVAHSGDPNNPGLGFSNYSAGTRIFAALSYNLEYFDFGGTTISLMFDSYPGAYNASYTYSGDMNGDGASGNDLIYIPRDQSEMNFEQYSATSGKVFTIADQKAAWDNYINQDEYLKENRGKYAERGGVVFPKVYRADLSIMQDVFAKFLGVRNSLQFRVDVMNITNLLNKNWGVNQRIVSTTPLTYRSVDASGKPVFRLASFGDNLIDHTFEQTSDVTQDVFRIQLGVRYTFN